MFTFTFAKILSRYTYGFSGSRPKLFKNNAYNKRDKSKVHKKETLLLSKKLNALRKEEKSPLGNTV